MRRAELAAEVELRRRRQKREAWHFLVTGDQTVGEHDEGPAYGKEWSRDYQPLPYPEAVPGSTTLPAEAYIGTGVGLLYGLEDERGGSEHLAWQLAGWNLPRAVFRDPVGETGRKTKPRILMPTETRKR